MRIGIITPAFQVAPYIGAAIASVLEQTHTDWSMVVVDDGSTDATPDQVLRWQHPRLRLIRQRHAGVSAARNQGMAAVEADALLFLDADDWLAPDALAVLAAALEAAPWAAAAAGCWARMRPGTAPTVHRPPAGDLLTRLLIRNRFANGGHLLLRHEAVEAAGRFRTDLCYGEDWEYWVRIALLGEFVAAPERHPLCFVRERGAGACARMAAQPGALQPCLDAIYALPDLPARVGRERLALLRRKADAEAAWVVGRELIRHGEPAQGQAWLRRSLVAAPSLRRTALAAAAVGAGWLPPHWRGPLRPYGDIAPLTG
jgi:glycosyltransferase involved in cell wall biosynthesis